MKHIFGVVLWFVMIIAVVIGIVVVSDDIFSTKTQEIGPNMESQVSPLNHIDLPEANITLKSDDFFRLIDQNTKNVFYAEVVPPPSGDKSFYFVINNPPSGSYQVAGEETITVYSESPEKMTVENDNVQKIGYFIVTIVIAFIVFMIGTTLIVNFL